MFFGIGLPGTVWNLAKPRKIKSIASCFNSNEIVLFKLFLNCKLGAEFLNSWKKSQRCVQLEATTHSQKKWIQLKNNLVAWVRIPAIKIWFDDMSSKIFFLKKLTLLSEADLKLIWSLWPALTFSYKLFSRAFNQIQKSSLETLPIYILSISSY